MLKMANPVPRRQVDELLTRWTLAKLPLVVVEGPSDQRFLMLTQQESHCQKELAKLDIWPVDYIDVPADLVEKYGFSGTGAKQRTISFGKEIEMIGCAEGFRVIVDKDLDPFLSLNYSSISVIYTDPSCMEVYSWTLESFSRMLVLYKCEKLISAPLEVEALYLSISRACADLTTVRLALARAPEIEAVLHQSEKTLSVEGKNLVFDLLLFVEQCKPKKGRLHELKKSILEIREELKTSSLQDLINGHDLEWVLTFVFRTLTQLPKRTIDPVLVSSSMTSYGVMQHQLSAQPMLLALTSWAKKI